MGVTTELIEQTNTAITNVPLEQDIGTPQAQPSGPRIGFYTEMGTKRNKVKNEDRISCATSLDKKLLDGSILTGYVGVFDGHGGFNCAEYINENMLRMVTDNFRCEDAWVKGEDVLRDVFNDLDNEYCSIAKKSEETSGACATVVVVRDEEALIANIGDCRAVHCNSKGKVIKASNDHRTGSISEKRRISQAGGKICNGRVCSLEPTRTFGDIDVKSVAGENVIIATPEVERLTFRGSKGDYLIVASDGLWDKVTNTEAAKACMKALSASNDPQIAAKALVQLAIQHASNDDITVAVMAF